MLEAENFKELEKAVNAYNEGKHEEAFKTFEKLSALEYNDDESQYYLGLMYFHGHYVPKDQDMAIALWKKSAKSRNQDAAFQLESLSMTRNTRY